MKKTGVEVEIVVGVDVDDPDLATLNWAARVTPGCPPPPASNPDSAAYGDPGSGPDIDDEHPLVSEAQAEAIRESLPCLAPLTDRQLGAHVERILRIMGFDTGQPDGDQWDRAARMVYDGE